MVYQNTSFDIYRNPHFDLVNNQLTKQQGVNKILRCFNSKEHGMFVWDAIYGAHDEKELAKQHGIEFKTKPSRFYIIRDKSGKHMVFHLDPDHEAFKQDMEGHRLFKKLNAEITTDDNKLLSLTEGSDYEKKVRCR